MALKTLTRGPQHGWGIARAIRDGSGGVFDVNQGSLYPALHRMKRRGWVTAEWRISDNGRRARYYTLTATGRRQLADQEEAWSESSSAVDRLLRWA
jgi:transcriptional regulator